MRRLAFILASTVAFSGCALYGEPPETEENLDQMKERADALEAKQQEDYAEEPVVSIVKDELYLGDGQSIQRPEIRDLPDFFDKNVTLVQPSRTLRDISNRLTDMVGRPVELATRLRSSGGQGGNESGGSGGDAGGGPLGGASAGLGMGDQPIAEKRMALSWRDDSLKGLLDTVAANYGITWEWKPQQGVVRFQRFKVKTYSIAALSGERESTSTMSNTTSSSGGGGGSDGASAGTAEMETEVVTDDPSTWDQVHSNLSQLKSSAGRIMVNQTAGTVTVMDSPSVIDTVDDFVRDLNRELSQQVSVQVKIFSLRLDDQKATNFDLSTVYSDLDGKFEMALGNATPVNGLTGSGELAASILTPSNGGGSSQTNRRMGGTSWLVEALDNQGEVSLVTSASGITLSGRTLPLQDVIRQTYISESQTTQTTDAGTQTDFQTDEITTGLQVQVQPKILSNNRIMLRYSMSLAALEELRQISSGGTTIEAPRTRTRSVISTAAMESGSTLVLADINRSQNEDQQQLGMVSQSENNDTSRSMLFVTFTVNSVEGAHLDGTQGGRS